MPRLTLYSKAGCHLCEALRAELDEMQPELGFTIDEVDIRREPALFDRYRHEIPVVLMDGVEIGRGRIDIAMVRDRIAATGRPEGRPPRNRA